MPLRTFSPFSLFRPFRTTPEVTPGEDAEILFHALTPDEDGVMQGVLKGTGGLITARTADILLMDHEGVYREFLAGEPGYSGGRVVLDPDKLFATFTVTAATPDPLTIMQADFSDGSTHRESYVDGANVLHSSSFASGASNTYRPADGAEISVYLGSIANVTVFRCYQNQLTGSIPDLSANTALVNFDCSTNQLTGSIPDLSANTALATFSCHTNELTGNIPDLSANTALVTFYCSTNQLTGSIPDLSANTALATFSCHTNQLTGNIPDLSTNTALVTFYCSGNQLTGSIPDLSANTALVTFSCHTNELTGNIPDLSTNTSLVNFYCAVNQLTGSIPDLSANTALVTFSCSTNQLTGSIPDLSTNTSLVNFYCAVNQLTGSIPDLSANTALVTFYCYANELTGFAGGWPNKAFLFDATNNALTEAAVNQILIDADTYGIATGTTITLTGGTNAAPTGAGATAKTNLIANGATVSTN